MTHTPVSQTLDLQGYSYEERTGVLPTLTSAFTLSGGWVIERKTLSAATMEFRIEIQLRAVLELYSQLVATGLGLTRAAHDTLTGLCTCRHNTGALLEPNQVITLRLEVSFLEDVTLHSLLMTGSGLA